MVMCQAVLRAQASHRVAWRKYPWDPLGAFREGIQGPTSRLQYIYLCFSSLPPELLFLLVCHDRFDVLESEFFFGCVVCFGPECVLAEVRLPSKALANERG